MADRSVVYRLRAEIGQLRTQMAQAGSSVRRVADEMTAATAEGEKFRSGLSGIGDTAGKIGLAAAGGLAFATKAAMDWETAWTGVLKTVDGSASELANLESGLRNLATETGFAHDEVAAVAEAAGQLGISTGSIEDFTQTMLDMGVSTNLSSEEAATGLARLRNIMGSTEAEIRNTGSAMVELGNNFATTEAEILAMSQRLAGAGRQAGLGTADVLGLATAMSSVGIEAEAGGTAMSITMKRIGKDVETGGGKIDLFAKTAGMSVEQFKKAWEDDAATALTAFVAGLSKAESMGMSTNAVLRELGVTGVREADALLRLSGNAEGLAGALASANEGFERNNALTEESGKFYDTTAQQAKQAWAEIKDAAIDAGAAMLPVVAEVASAVGGMASAFGALPKPVQGATTGLLGITAIVGGGLWFTSRAINGVASMRQSLADLSQTAPRAASALRGVASAGAAIAVALPLMAQMNQLISESIDLGSGDLNRDIESVFQGTSSQAVEDFLGHLDLARDKTVKLFDIAQKPLTGYGLWGDTALEKVSANFEAVDDTLANLVESGNADKAAAFVERAQAGWESVGGSVEDVTDVLPNYQQAVKNAAAASDDAADSATGAAGATDDLGGAMAGATPMTEEMAAALKEAREAATGATETFLNLTAGVKDGKFSFKDWITSLREAATAVRDLRKNANTAEERGLDTDLVTQLESMGTEGAVQLAYFAKANDRELEQANRAWRRWGRQSSATIEEVANDIAGFDDGPTVTPQLNLNPFAGQLGLAEGQLDRFGKKKPEPTASLNLNPFNRASVGLNSVLDRINNRDVSPAVRLLGVPAAEATLAQLTRAREVAVNIRTNKPSSPLPGSADGSTVPKDGGPYEDRYPYLLAPGEEVTSNRRGQADTFRSELKDINAGMSRSTVINRMLARGLADGGTAVRYESVQRRPVGAIAAAGSSSASMPRHMHLTGTVQSDLGPMRIEGIARAAARDEIDQQNTWERTQ